MEKTYEVCVYYFAEVCPLPSIDDIIAVQIPIKYAHCKVDEQNYIASIIYKIVANYIEEVAENEEEKYFARLNYTVSFYKT